MILNKWEIEILNIAKEDGKINDTKLRLIYRDPVKRREAVTRLSQLGYLKTLVPGSFAWTGKEFEKKVIKKKNSFTQREKELLIIILESEIESFGNANLLQIEYERILEKVK